MLKCISLREFCIPQKFPLKHPNSDLYFPKFCFYSQSYIFSMQSFNPFCLYCCNVLSWESTTLHCLVWYIYKHFLVVLWMEPESCGEKSGILFFIFTLPFQFFVIVKNKYLIMLCSLVWRFCVCATLCFCLCCFVCLYCVINVLMILFMK